ncbi:hypothetical protein EB796_000382 [Bugula neritina]|uniref:Uncharacterized protein n=1 Tax=Bugula neritina TaxID=10212 RepID=A0A7J7KSV8_BUGNE|nr:hypothetical protein EB796_000382 [Bugula neritina]
MSAKTLLTVLPSARNISIGQLRTGKKVMFSDEVKIGQSCGARTFVHLPQSWSVDALLLRGGYHYYSNT